MPGGVRRWGRDVGMGCGGVTGRVPVGFQEGRVSTPPGEYYTEHSKIKYAVVSRDNKILTLDTRRGRDEL